MFEVAEAYEDRMGRWSRQLAPLFVQFVGVRDGENVLDVGYNTNSPVSDFGQNYAGLEDRRDRSF